MLQRCLCHARGSKKQDFLDNKERDTYNDFMSAAPDRGILSDRRRIRNGNTIQSQSD